MQINDANWAYETNISAQNQARVTEVEIRLNEMQLSIIQEAMGYHGVNKDEQRQLMLISLKAGAPRDRKVQKRMSELGAQMVEIYSTAKVDGKVLEPDLTNIMAKNRDYDQLLEAYIGFRNATGPRIKKLYPDFIAAQNEGARDAGFADASELWRGQYEMTGQEFTEMMETVWKQVLPLYEQIHCYTKYKIAEKYPDHMDANDDYIPAHLLGNMWSQDWSNIYSDILIPFPDVTPVEITPELEKQNFTPKMLHELSESFYVSLGYDHLPATFWEKSMLTKPIGREVVCHASAWDMDGHDDLRIKMCTAVTGEELLTVHHEQGHLYYDHYYRSQIPLYRESAADFFHEAIGDTMVLSVVVPRHLQEIGLLKGKISSSLKQTINAQMAVALSKIAILPWTYMIDLYRWKIQNGQTQPEDYQKEWEKLMMTYQGIKRPVESTAEDFDAGAKYHVPANTPYVRYFGAAIVQFQFHEALCEDAGQGKILHDCSIYKNKKAGDHFKELLKLGRSKPWQEALFQGTGGKFKTLDAASLIRYFKPLIQWLEKQNEGKKCGWTKRAGGFSV